MTNATNLLARLQEVSCTPANSVGIQIDLETWGKKPGCAIRSIGASVWDNMTGQPVELDAGNKFYVNVCKKSCFDKGLTFDADTVRWWEQQGDAAKVALEDNQMDITRALSELRAWYHAVINTHGRHVSVWGNGKEFDVSILESCYAAIHQRAPWPFWASADVRTVVLLGQMLGIDVKGTKAFNGTPHYALDDSLHQGGYTAETLRLIKLVFDVGLQALNNPENNDRG